MATRQDVIAALRKKGYTGTIPGEAQEESYVDQVPQQGVLAPLLNKIVPRSGELLNNVVQAGTGGRGLGDFAMDPKGKLAARSGGDDLATFMAKEKFKAGLKQDQPETTGVYTFNPTRGEFEEVGNVPKGSIVRNTTTIDDIGAKEGAKASAQFGGEMATSDRAMNLRKEFQALPSIQEYQTIKNQVGAMDALLKEAPKYTESKLALDQALISLFNKITDPTSVVRESEYERTPQNLSLVNRFNGALDKLKTGGAGLTQEDRQALVFGAKVIANSRGKSYNEVLGNYENLANRFQVEPDLVVSGYGKHENFPYEMQMLDQAQSQVPATSGWNPNAVIPQAPVQLTPDQQAKRERLRQKFGV